MGDREKFTVDRAESRQRVAVHLGHQGGHVGRDVTLVSELLEGLEFLDDPIQAECGQVVPGQEPGYDVLEEG